jgi:hypothetical protein
MKVIQLAALFGGAALAAGPLAVPRKSIPSVPCPLFRITVHLSHQSAPSQLLLQVIAQACLTL